MLEPVETSFYTLSMLTQLLLVILFSVVDHVIVATPLLKMASGKKSDVDEFYSNTEPPGDLASIQERAETFIDFHRAALNRIVLVTVSCYFRQLHPRVICVHPPIIHVTK